MGAVESNSDSTAPIALGVAKRQIHARNSQALPCSFTCAPPWLGWL